MSNVNIFGKVVRVLNDNKVVMNKGEKDGISDEDRFLIYSMGEELFDPDTQESLGRLEIVKGIAKPESILEKMTTLVSDKYKPGERVIRERKSTSTPLFPNLWNVPSTEIEKIEFPPTRIPFEDVIEGDFIKPMKKKI